MERGNGGGVVGRGGRGAFRGKGCRERGGSGSQFLRRADSCTRASLNVKRRLQRRLHTYHSILQYINPQHIVLHIHGPHTMRITHDAYHPPHGKTHTKTCCRAAISCTSAGPRERIAFCSHRFRVYGFGIKSAHVLLSYPPTPLDTLSHAVTRKDASASVLASIFPCSCLCILSCALAQDY